MSKLPDDYPEKKRCPTCGEWKDSRADFYTTRYRGKPYPHTDCKDCEKAKRREAYHRDPDNGQWEHKGEYSRARGRALTRLSKLVPELYDTVLNEELAKEGLGPRKTRFSHKRQQSVTIDTNGAKRGPR